MIHKGCWDKIHVQKVGEILKTYCGRRVGTPRGIIYPGVRAEIPQWWRGHPYREVVNEIACQRCSYLARREV